MISLLRPKKIVTLFIDVAFMYLALYVALSIRHFTLDSGARFQQGLLPFSIVFCFYVLVFYIMGLYTLQDLRSFSRRFQKTVTAFLLAVGTAFIVFYLMPNDSYSPKSILLLQAAVYFVLFSLWRLVANPFLGIAYPSLRTAFLGWDPSLQEILTNQDLLKTYNLDCRLLYSPEPLQVAEELPIQPDADLQHVETALAEHQLDLVVINSSMQNHEQVRQLLFQRLSPRAVYMSFPEFYEMVLARVPINAINQMWFLEHLQFRNKVAYEKFKRIADFGAAFVALLISFPLWPFIGLAIKVSSRGPVFFSQTRAGKNAKPFTIIKFRTMRTEGNSHGITVEGDSRITGVGGFLRKSRLDELPQLINILRGQMSFVGPRPERPEIITELEKEVPFYRQRMLVVPGLTGWDQVSGEYHGATVEDTRKKLQYDLYYVKNRSVYLDITIVLKTIATVLGRAGR